MVLKNIYHCVW